MKGLLVIFVLLSCSASYSQSTFNGRVIESGTMQPLPYANVYFASTSIGAVTDAEGKFKFTAQVSGKFNLVVSFVGFVTHQLSIIVKTDSTYHFEFKLELRNQELQGLVVQADTSKRKRDLKRFEKIFLGEMPNASDCRIRNTKDISLTYESGGIMSAFANTPIIIENKALGYLLYYDLEKFEATLSGTASIKIWGVCRFEELKTPNLDQEKQWAKAREKSYRGSITHLMSAIKSNQLKSEGWEVLIIYPKNRPSDGYINRMISKMVAEGNEDSVKYYMYLKYLPPNSKLTSAPLNGKELLAAEDNHKVNFIGTLSATFKDQPRDGSHTRNDTEHSELYFKNSILIFDNGHFAPQSNLEVSGYFARRGRASEFMPYDYTTVSLK